MKRLIIGVLGTALLMLAQLPASAAATSFTGKGSARALDLSIPALNILGEQTANQFKGLTVGATAVSFNSSEESAAASGLAAGHCQLVSVAVSTDSTLPCTGAAMETSNSSTQIGDGNASCADLLSLYAVSITTACGNSTSRVEGGRPVGLNEAGVTNIDVTLDLTALGFVNFLEQEKDAVVDSLANLMDGVFEIANQQQLNELEAALGEALESVKQGGQAAKIRLGPSSTNVTRDGVVSTVTSKAAGATIGLLGISDALSDGLIIIEVSPAMATASVNDTTAIGSSKAEAALATVKVRDLLDLEPGPYFTVVLSPGDLNALLAPLNNTLLETSIDLASATEPQTGSSVSASASAVGIRALKGLGASGRQISDLHPGNRDGGLTLELAAVDVQIVSVLGGPLEPPLPITGGPIFMYLAGAAVLAVSAPFVYRLARRIRQG